MVAQPMPARTNIAFISQLGLLSRRKPAVRKAAVSITTPARMVFLRPNFDEMMPTGRYERIAAACAMIIVRL